MWTGQFEIRARGKVKCTTGEIYHTRGQGDTHYKTGQGDMYYKTGQGDIYYNTGKWGLAPPCMLCYCFPVEASLLSVDVRRVQKTELRGRLVKCYG